MTTVGRCMLSSFLVLCLTVICLNGEAAENDISTRKLSFIKVNTT